MLMLSVLIFSRLQLMQYEVTGYYMEDALAASNLASAVIDLQEYGSSHKVKIAEPLRAYGLYCQALKGNLNLDDTWQCPNNAAISGPVRIISYIIYNVSGETVEICSVAGSGQISESTGRLGTVKAPNGIVVGATSVYSEISFPVKGIWNTEAVARKGKLVDIVAEGEQV